MRRIAPMLLAALLAALSACSTAPGTGWSRAGDLRVYGAMHVYERAALDQEMLCAGFTPASTRDAWAREFGVREAAVAAALERALRARRRSPRRARPGRRASPAEPCPTRPGAGATRGCCGCWS